MYLRYIYRTHWREVNSRQGHRRKAQRLDVRFNQFGSGVVNADTYRSIMQDIVRHIEDGHYHSILDRTFGFTEIAEAHRYMEANRAVGKVVVLTPSA